ncbi:hypothetical protein JOC34_002645 [Virgibacillus halotolerans]|nr:hypothetical protein [Virgibacillus halotolerans]
MVSYEQIAYFFAHNAHLSKVPNIRYTIIKSSINSKHYIVDWHEKRPPAVEINGFYTYTNHSVLHPDLHSGSQ